VEGCDSGLARVVDSTLIAVVMRVAKEEGHMSVPGRLVHPSFRALVPVLGRVHVHGGCHHLQRANTHRR